MLRVLVIATALCLPLAAPAQQTDEDGRSLIEEGAKLFFRGLMEEVEPALKDLQALAEGMEPALQDFVANMGPALRDILGQVEDWSDYHPPEMLPNGDIILRRKQPAEVTPSPEVEL